MIVLTGLHGSGKSHLCSILKSEGCYIVNKREILSRMFLDQGRGYSFDDWMKHQYTTPGNGAANMMLQILDYVPKDQLIQNMLLVFDAIHNLAEWEVIYTKYPNSILALVASPLNVRASRNSIEDEILDKKRVQYWHESSVKGKSSCLMSHVEACFNGNISDTVQTQIVREFISTL